MDHPTTSLFWFVASACVGGAIIAIGLVLEFFKGGVKTFGEILVILGIMLETVVAFLTAKEQWRIIQFTRQNDPEKRHIVSMEARVSMEAHFKNTNEIPSLRWIRLDFSVPYKKQEHPKSTGPIALMATNGAMSFASGETNGYTPWLDVDLTPANFGGFHAPMPDYEIEDLNTNVQIILDANIFTPGVEITKGSITLNVNSSVVKYYRIPPFTVSGSKQPFIFTTNAVEAPW